MMVKMGDNASNSLFGILKAAGDDIVGILEINKNWDHMMVCKRYEN